MAEASAIREVDLVMVMLMDMVLQVEDLVGRAAMVLLVKVMGRPMEGMVLEEAATGAISNEKDPVGMTTEMPNDRDTRCGWVRSISSVLFSSYSCLVRIRGLKFHPALGGLCKYRLPLLLLCCHQRKYISILSATDF